MRFRPLSEMTVGNRIALAVVVVLAILFALAMCGYLGGRWDDAQAQTVEVHVGESSLYADNPLDMRLLQLDKRALDEAYHQQLLKLWGVWMAGGAQETKYFQTGLTNARRAYNNAAKQISDRESILFERDRQRDRQQQDQPR